MSIENIFLFIHTKDEMRLLEFGIHIKVIQMTVTFKVWNIITIGSMILYYVAVVEIVC